MREMSRKTKNHPLLAALLCGVLIVLSVFPSFAEETGRDKLDDATVYFKNLFGEARLVCDLEENPAYQNVAISRMTEDLEQSYDLKVQEYRNQYITVIGTVTEISENAAKVTLTDVEGTGGNITAKSSDAGIRQTISTLQTGDTVRVYGKAQVGSRFDKTVTIKIDRIEKTLRRENSSSSVYSFLSGASFDKEQGLERTISGKLQYVCPEEWKDVEEEISATGMQGYVYRLNEISSAYKTQPEQAYVFYFDYETGLKYLSDRDERVSQIERAIISNILIYDSASDFPDRNITMENGQKFTYYDTSYQGGDHKIHNVEFIFSPGDDGLACVMYVFNSSDHKEDIIYLLRTLTWL